jgi:UDPglucose 6-dehydrogenase
MKLCIIGTGYVGLVAGTCFAETGNDVICVDVDETKIRNLKAGKIPIYEPGLEQMVRHNIGEERLEFSTDLAGAVKKCPVIFITVGTPQGDDGSADLKYVLDVAREVGQAMNGEKIIVIKSTVPVGTCEKVEAAVKSVTKLKSRVVSNPEFLKEGHAVEDFMRPDRIIIGCTDEKAAGVIKEIYQPFLRTGRPLLVMDVRAAEMSKYAANAMLATRISFMNMLANLAERLGVNIEDVRRGVGSDARIGNAFLFPGTGYGGSCFPKDVRALMKTAEEADYDLCVLKAVDSVNEAQKIILYEKAKKYYGGNLKGKKIAVWGLAFKPQTDDIRDAPAIATIEKLLADGAKVLAFDPAAMETTRAVFGGRIEYAAKSYDALKDADALLVITEWNEFRSPDFGKMKKLMKKPVIFDGRNIYPRKVVEEAGFEYFGIGV